MVITQLEQRMRGVGGWLRPQEAVVLERLARDQVVMEIGSYLGKSTVVVAEVAKKVICIDYFLVEGNSPKDATGRYIPPAEKPETRNIFERNVKPWRHKIEVHELNTFDAVKLNWEPVGLLFIDGGHDTATVLNDCGFLKWVVVDGYVAFHDASWTNVERAIRQVMANNPEWKRVPTNCSNMSTYQRILPSQELVE